MSTKAKMMHLTLKYRHLLKGQLRPDVIDKNTAIEKLRQECDEVRSAFSNQFLVSVI